MACGCKNKGNATTSKSVVKTSSPSKQEARPQKPVTGTRIIKREIR